jgi:hypothetical protein
MVEVDGQTVDLKDCAWIQYRPCGCPCGVLSAAFGDTAFANEDQAQREFTPLKKDRDRSIKQGYTLQLVTSEHYRKHIDILASCDACKPKQEAAA